LYGCRRRGIDSTMTAAAFERLIRKRLSEVGETAIRAAKRAGLPPDAIRSVLRGHPPNLVRAGEICEALGLELRIGVREERPPRTPGRASRTPRWAEELRAGVRADVATLLLRMAAETPPEGMAASFGKPDGEPVPSARAGADRSDDPGYAPDEPLPGDLGVLLAQDVRASAGEGAATFDERKRPAARLGESDPAHGICLENATCMRVAGDSMEPGIRDGDLLVVDHDRVEPEDGAVFVFRVADGLLVKRLRWQERRWTFVSDNSRYQARPVREDERIVGRVAWHGPPVEQEADAA